LLLRGFRAALKWLLKHAGPPTYYELAYALTSRRCQHQRRDSRLKAFNEVALPQACRRATEQQSPAA
jgi:hypothetical protein